MQKAGFLAAAASLLVACSAAPIDPEPPAEPTRTDEAPQVPGAPADQAPPAWTPWRAGEAWQPCNAANGCNAGLVCLTEYVAYPGPTNPSPVWGGWFLWCAPPCDPKCTEAAKGCQTPCEKDRACLPSSRGPVCLLNAQPESG